MHVFQKQRQKFISHVCYSIDKRWKRHGLYVSKLTIWLGGFFFQVCYSWWVLASLVMMDRMHWIDKKSLEQFILDCQVWSLSPYHCGTFFCSLHNHTQLRQSSIFLKCASPLFNMVLLPSHFYEYCWKLDWPC